MSNYVSYVWRKGFIMDKDNTATQEGMVAFMDILGYTSFLQNNEPEVAAQTVLNNLLNAPKSVDDFFDKAIETVGGTNASEGAKFIKNQVDRQKWLIFSDTILVTSAYEPTDSAIEKAFGWSLFLQSLRMLYRHLFENGLPIRGGVCHGRFFIKNTCFAGRSIISAYQLANRLELSAIALDESAIEEVTKIDKEAHSMMLPIHSVKYLVPTKNQTYEKMHVLLPSTNLQPTLDVSDVRQLVAESFWKHSKDLGPGVLTKLDNTELFFRHVKMTNPKVFVGNKKLTPKPREA